jgi:hypothetical protein
MSVATSIRLPQEDITMAREQAVVRGIKYQTYLKMIIHQEIHKELAMMGKKPKKNPFDKEGVEKKGAAKKHAAKKTAKKMSKKDEK